MTVTPTEEGIRMINNYMPCFVCEEGYFHPRVNKATIRPPYGPAFTVKAKYAVCNECGTEVQTMMDTDSNVQNMRKLSHRMNQMGQKLVKI